ncbi:MAG: LytTR family DNA-binding domain-containing protein [Lachnospiraceae bacterium]|nr:LytTR family DNA-binding domain-containing protein [Lachnospiraceae bacterium]
MYYIGVCDDEKSTCARIVDMIYEYDRRKKIEIEVTVWHTGEELYQDMMRNQFIDLLFLDIDLISTDGIQIGRKIRHELENQDIGIVFISSKSSYALELFKIHPMDFLIKPIHEQDIFDTLDEALRLYNRNNTVFEYKANGYSCKIPYKNIVYFYSENKKINMVTSGATIQFTGKIKDLAEIIPENFIQIHQSYIINMNYMNECSYEAVKMNEGTQLNISQPYRKQVRKHIMDYAWGQDS